ncbi:hypothetical protein OC835_001057 [Tilletia horrida]|nr:hypothetical protein OC835_001057 [Tilletia horrida]
MSSLSQVSGVYPTPRPLLTTRWPLKPLVMAVSYAYLIVRTPLLAAIYAVLPFTRPNPKLPVMASVAYSSFHIIFPLKTVLGTFTDRRGTKTLDPYKPGDRFKGVWIAPARPQLLTGQIGEWLKQGGIKTVPLPGYWVGKDKDLDDVTARPGERIILNFHGGGYIDHTAHWTSPISNFFGELIERIPDLDSQRGDKVRITRGFNLEYRLSDETTFPGIVADAVAAYAFLVETCGFEPAHITVMGDSAGGHLALALIRHLRDTKVLPIPGNAVLTSPWTDLSMTTFHTTASAKANAGMDYLRNPAIIVARDQVIRGMPIGSLESPYLSPGLRAVVNAHTAPALYKAFPPALFIAGGKERWHDEIVMSYHDYVEGDAPEERRRREQSALLVEDDYPHDYVAFMQLGSYDAGIRAIERIYDFIAAAQA